MRDPVHQFEVINWPSFALLSQYQYLFPRLISRINNESYYLLNLDGYLEDLGWLRMYHQYSAICYLTSTYCDTLSWLVFTVCSKC
jgi:hypothetical protein